MDRLGSRNFDAHLGRWRCFHSRNQRQTICRLTCRVMKEMENAVASCQSFVSTTSVMVSSGSVHALEPSERITSQQRPSPAVVGWRKGPTVDEGLPIFRTTDQLNHVDGVKSPERAIPVTTSS